MLEVLKGVDTTFREIPHTSDRRLASSYIARGGLRVDFLPPNEGPDTDSPQNLPALQTDAQPLRFLDFLIHEPEQALVLHGPGIHVRVPAPERYAVHELIVSMRRRAGVAKRDKDLQQVEILIEALAEKRPGEFKGDKRAHASPTDTKLSHHSASLRRVTFWVTQKVPPS
jgi:hypothetical protein